MKDQKEVYNVLERIEDDLNDLKTWFEYGFVGEQMNDVKNALCCIYGLKLSLLPK